MTAGRLLRLVGLTLLAIYCAWCVSAFTRYVVHHERTEWQKARQP